MFRAHLVKSRLEVSSFGDRSRKKRRWTDPISPAPPVNRMHEDRLIREKEKGKKDGTYNIVSSQRKKKRREKKKKEEEGGGERRQKGLRRYPPLTYNLVVNHPAPGAIGEKGKGKKKRGKTASVKGYPAELPPPIIERGREKGGGEGKCSQESRLS